MNSEFPTYSFKLEFYDERADLVRPYVLSYFTRLGEIEIYDLRQRRTFLKKTTNHNVQIKDLYIGSKLLINGRQYEIIDYQNEDTRNAFNQQSQHTYAMLKPGFVNRLGEAIERITESGLVVCKLRYGYVSKETAAKFYQEHEGKPFYNDLVNYITSGPIVAMDLVGPNAIKKWRTIIGPTNLDTAKKEAPNSLRALYARSTTENFAHGSDAPESAARELQIIFGENAVELASQCEGSTLCIIKPHAIQEGLAGPIIRQIIGEGFTIAGAVMTTLEIPTAGEFLEIYKTVVGDYSDMVSELASGLLIALELVKDNAVSEFRKLCGPRDVSVAKQIRPQSLRALFGTDLVHNAVHCTDLEEDAPLEVEYFFVILESA